MGIPVQVQLLLSALFVGSLDFTGLFFVLKRAMPDKALLFFDILTATLTATLLSVAALQDIIVSKP